jgi:putative cell wall-binding protein
VSTDVEADLMAAGIEAVERFSGDDRFETAAAVTEEIVSASSAEEVAVFVTEGINPDPLRGWPDAVAVSSLAAFLEQGLLLVHRDQAPEATLAALSDLAVTRATIVGGEAAVAVVVESAVSDPNGDGSDDVIVDRIAGDTRYDTSAAVAEAAVEAGASPASVWLATGSFWADALAAGPAGGILVLVRGSATSTAAADEWLTAHLDELEWLRIAGGPAAVTPAAAEHLDQLVSF